MEPNYWLVLSSMSFIAPTILCYNLNNPILYGVLIMVIYISSAYHATKIPYLLYLDIPLLYTANLITLYNILPGGWKTIPYYLVWLVYALFVYYYGQIHKTMVWNPNLKQATKWHMSLHISTSIMTCYTLYVTHQSVRL